MKESFFNTEIDYLYEASLKNYNTYRIECIAKYIVFPKNVEEIKEIIEICNKENLNYIVLGNGSNVIFESDYYEGVIIKLSNLNEITFNGNIVKVGAGYSLIKLAAEATEKGLDGLTFASGIPGAVGASVAMNAGAYNEDMSNIVKEVTVLTPKLEIIKMNNDEIVFEYRNSFFKQNTNYIILDATLELSYGNKEEMQKEIIERRQKRQATQPLDKPCAGSVFRNPELKPAGALIEELGLKGYKIGNAEVSTKHANFIINRGNATGKDIISLINKIKKEVKEKYNIDLLLEQIIIK